MGRSGGSCCVVDVVVVVVVTGEWRRDEIIYGEVGEMAALGVT